ncbi:MAG: hypothetical protein GY805_14355 [Chloroflexi bacterium]|nr:hypothetical protein [Chloroflexota bacterium]
MIWRNDKWGQRGYFQFSLLYVDASGVKHKHRVSRNFDLWGGLKDDFFWDKPLQIPGSATESSNLRSKEQIISEMDAEIKQLQEKLKMAQKGD